MYTQLERYKSSRKVVRVAKYGRCSSDEQKKNGYTISDQLTLMDDFIAEYELIGVGTYIDEGISATLEIRRRKALVKLIEDAKAGKFDIVIFKCIDRFFRNIGEYYECQKQLTKAGVTWISIEENDLDPDDPDASFKINIYLTMAEYEAKKTSKRILFNNKNRIKNKQVVTGAQNFPFAWKVVGEPKNRHLERDMEKAEMLYDLLDYFETHQSKSSTIGYINVKYATPISLDMLTRLLKNTLLYGEYKGVSNYVEPYITKERFDRIQDILKRNARYDSKTSTDYSFLFSGLIKCPNCGRNLAGNHSTSTIRGKKYHAYGYRCNKNRKDKMCSFNKYVGESKIEKQLLTNLELYINNTVARIDEVKDNTPKNNNEIKIAKLKAELERVNFMYRKGRMEEEEYDEEYLILETKIKDLESNIAPPSTVNVDALKGLLETDFRGLYDQLTKENKKAFWRNLIKEFTVNENMEIVEDSIIFF